MKELHGYVGRVHSREGWYVELKTLVQEGAASGLDPHYLHDELVILAESALLLLDAKEEAEEATS